jgi:hypothetical protein
VGKGVFVGVAVGVSVGVRVGVGVSVDRGWKGVEVAGVKEMASIPTAVAVGDVLAANNEVFKILERKRNASKLRRSPIVKMLTIAISPKLDFLR